MQRQTFPLLAGQRWLACLAEHSPDMARPVQRIYRCRKPLDTAALLAAFRQVVGRHPALRLRLVTASDEWRQYFVDNEVVITGLSIRDRTPQIRAAYAQHVLADLSRKPLDLSRDAPILANIIELDGEYIFSLCIDHIAADDIAFDALVRQLRRAYECRLRGVENDEFDGAGRFFQYLERETASREREAANLDYWRGQLADAQLADNAAEEPTWSPGTTDHWTIGGESYRALQSACRTHKCSAFHAVVAALANLLSELRDTDDVVLNLPVSNRTRASDYEIVANLSMLLHVRFRLLRRSTSPSYLRTIRDHLLEAMVHRQYDYRALSDAMIAAAKARGGVFDWLVGCSFIVDRDDSEGDILFSDRYDDQPDRRADVPRGSFAVTCRAFKDRLEFEIDRDTATWPQQSSVLSRRYCDLLAAVTGLPPIAPEPIG